MDVACIGKLIQSITRGVFGRLTSVALTVYEHLLSFDAELRVIWRRKLNLPNLLFLLNRYLLLLFALSLVLWSLVKPYGSDKVRFLARFLCRSKAEVARRRTD